MRGIVMAGVIASLFAMLTGCPKKAAYENAHALENPPPKLPNCPDLPELKNITLKDGSIADVRIVQFRETKLYVPTDLIKSAFYDEKATQHKTLNVNKFYVPSGLLGFNPDLHANECPGVVHKVRTDKNSVSKGFSFFDGKAQKESIHNKNVTFTIQSKNISTKSTIFKLSFNLFEKSYAEEGYVYPYQGYETAQVRFFDDIYVSYNTSFKEPDRSKLGSPEWVLYRDSVVPFARWLATPPRDRDNDRIFILGVKSQ